LCARSKAFRAAASSREGWRGGAGAGLCVGFVVVAALDLVAGAVLAGADFFALALTGTGAFFLAGAVAAAGRAFAATPFGLAALLDCFGAGREAFAAGADFFGVALRTGAFSAAERFGLG
jgi:hypothetical protein